MTTFTLLAAFATYDRYEQTVRVKKKRRLRTKNFTFPMFL